MTETKALPCCRELAPPGFCFFTPDSECRTTCAAMARDSQKGCLSSSRPTTARGVLPEVWRAHINLSENISLIFSPTFSQLSHKWNKLNLFQTSPISMPRILSCHTTLWTWIYSSLCYTTCKENALTRQKIQNMQDVNATEDLGINKSVPALQPPLRIPQKAQPKLTVVKH